MTTGSDADLPPLRNRLRAYREYEWRRSSDRHAEQGHANAGGRSAWSKPIDRDTRGSGGIAEEIHDPNVTGPKFSVVHKQAGQFVAGQTLGSSDPAVQVESFAGDPEGQLGFADSAPVQEYVAQITGVVHMRISWKWGHLAAGPSAGRFRTEAKVKVTRTRAGETVSRTYTDGRIGAAGRLDRIALDCIKGDRFRVALPHDGGDQVLDEDDPGEWQITVWQTGPPTLPEGPPYWRAGYTTYPAWELEGLDANFERTRTLDAYTSLAEHFTDLHGEEVTFVNPQGIAWDGGNLCMVVYVVPQGSGFPFYFVRLNPETGAVVESKWLGNDITVNTPGGLVYDATSGTFWTSDGGADKIWEFDPTDDPVVPLSTLFIGVLAPDDDDLPEDQGSGGLAIRNAGNLTYVSVGSTTLSYLVELDQATNERDQVGSWVPPPRPYGLVWTGEHYVHGSSQNSNMYRRDPDGTLVETITNSAFVQTISMGLGASQ